MSPWQSVGDTYADLVVWRWDRSRMRFVAEIDDGNPDGPCELIVQFQKGGGRWSKGTGGSFWQITVDNTRFEHRKYPNADEAKEAAVTEFKRQHGARA